MAKPAPKVAHIKLPDPLPQVLEECHQLIFQLQERILVLEKQSRRQKRDKFGRSTAQTPANNIEGPGKEIYDEINEAITTEENQKGVCTAAPAHGGGGRKIPQSVPEKETVQHKITDEDTLLCPCCRVPRTPIGFKVSTQLDYIPARFESIRHVEFKYSCPNCKSNVIEASKPLQPIDKGYPTAALVAHILTSLFAHHLPFYRQEQIFANRGIPIKRSTLSRWKNQAAQELAIVVKRMRELVLKGKVVYSDGTSMPYLLKGSGEAQRGCIWYVGGDAPYPYRTFVFSEDETNKHPATFLKDFTGFLLTDSTNKYNPVLKNIKEGRDGATSANCWAHVYRKFEDAKNAEEKLADYAIGVIKSLFRIERFAQTQSENERVKIRNQFSLRLIERFKGWLDEQAEIAAPTALADAVKYTLNNWIALTQFVDHGFLKIHNNDSENALRAVVKGRINWLFAGSTTGAENSAIVMSLVQTCIGLGINPEEYLTDVLARLPATPISQIDQFLPDRWQASRAKSPSSAAAPLQSISA